MLYHTSIHFNVTLLGGCNVGWFTFCITIQFLQSGVHLHAINMALKNKNKICG